MNLNWTEIKAGRVDCDWGDGGGGGLCFFFFPLSDKSRHPHAERLAGAAGGANVTPGYNGIHPGCVTFTTIMTLTHTHQSQ